MRVNYLDNTSQPVILPDFEIRHLCEEYNLVEGWSAALLNPASLDVRLGATLLTEVPETPELQPIDIRSTTAESPYLLTPGQFILASTIESFNLPNDICARFMLKSSRAREGLEHLLAGFADPGFNSATMTLELQNVKRYHSVKLWYGMRIGQMVFELMASPPERGYGITGRYNGQQQPTPSKG